MATKRILTGIRPMGPLHLGHYVGALKQWIELQDKYECFFLIADIQALTTHVDQPQLIEGAVRDVMLDWISVGLDPEKTNFVIQSYIPEHAELAMLLSTIIPKGMIDINPTLKSEMARQKNVSLGFYNYPASQVADILLPKANLVPVGEDQLPHIELAREIARKFNKMYGQVFPIPEALVGRVPRLVGIDGGAKMSKSLNNCIYLSDSKDVVMQKVKKMYTDPTRLRATDLGHIEGNVVFTYLDSFYTDKNELERLRGKYVQGKIGDVEVKDLLAKLLNQFLDPIREKRKYYESHPKKIRDSLVEGTLRAKKVAQSTMVEVKNALNIINYEDIKNLKKLFI